MSFKDNKLEMEALVTFLSFKETLQSVRDFDYVICDSSPGLQHSSINSIVAADVLLVVTSIDKSYIDGNQRMKNDLYDLNEKRLKLSLTRFIKQFFLEKHT
jgi:cellulose biosynthesis protein BcsQ